MEPSKCTQVTLRGFMVKARTLHIPHLIYYNDKILTQGFKRLIMVSINVVNIIVDPREVVSQKDLPAVKDVSPLDEH